MGGLILRTAGRTLHARVLSRQTGEASSADCPPIAPRIARPEAFRRALRGVPVVEANERSRIMSPRFLSNIVLALAGGFLVVASQVFTPGVVMWLALGTGLGVFALAGLLKIERRRGVVQRTLDAAAGALGILTVIASVVFDGSTLTWLSFSASLGFVGLALMGLIAHELRYERIVHTLQVPELDREPAPADRYSTAA
jgi:peptidoglycan/LPS O-acetylase OafA/YrhL